MRRPPRVARVAVLAFATLAAVAASATLAARDAQAARVSGVVRTIQRPLGGVQVIDPATGAYAATDSAGRFTIALEAGVHELHLAAVGYAGLVATITVPAGDAYDSGPWLLEPLRPDGGIGLLAAAPLPADTAKAADSLTIVSTPLPAPIAPDLTFEWSDAERARWLAPLPANTLAPGAPEGLAREILLAIATSDSISRTTGGTGAPGPESWRQWGDRLTALGLEPELRADSVFLRRAVAYVRTRGALATGPTWSGWQSSKTARTAVASARRDTPDSAFVAQLQGVLDRTFVAGTEPAKPKPAPPPKKKKKRSTKKH